MENKQCPYCGEEIKQAAVKCRYCNSDLTKREEQWFRNHREKSILGVCAALSHVLGIPLTILRIGFLVLTLFKPPFALLYIGLYLFIPYSKEDPAPIMVFFERLKVFLGAKIDKNEEQTKPQE